jgi:hypothetical protein
MSENDTSRYDAAIRRNLAELQRALLNRRAMVAMEAVGGITDDILKVIYYALFNDYISHCIKVFERSSGAASFWYVYDTNQKPINQYARKHHIDIGAFEPLVEKLKHVRDKTHFHIDRDAVLNSNVVWREAGLNGQELAAAVDNAWELLNALQEHLGRDPLDLPPFDDDVMIRVTKLIEAGRVPQT